MTVSLMLQKNTQAATWSCYLRHCLQISLLSKLITWFLRGFQVPHKMLSPLI